MPSSLRHSRDCRRKSRNRGSGERSLTARNYIPTVVTRIALLHRDKFDKNCRIATRREKQSLLEREPKYKRYDVNVSIKRVVIITEKNACDAKWIDTRQETSEYTTRDEQKKDASFTFVFLLEGKKDGPSLLEPRQSIVHLGIMEL